MVCDVELFGVATALHWVTLHVLFGPCNLYNQHLHPASSPLHTIGSRGGRGGGGNSVSNGVDVKTLAFLLFTSGHAANMARHTADHRAYVFSGGRQPQSVAVPFHLVNLDHSLHDGYGALPSTNMRLRPSPHTFDYRTLVQPLERARAPGAAGKRGYTVEALGAEGTLKEALRVVTELVARVAESDAEVHALELAVAGASRQGSVVTHMSGLLHGVAIDDGAGATTMYGVSTGTGANPVIRVGSGPIGGASAAGRQDNSSSAASAASGGGVSGGVGARGGRGGRTYSAVIAEKLDVTKEEARALIAAGAMGNDDMAADDCVNDPLDEESSNSNAVNWR